jgi:hypothetical protein
LFEEARTWCERQCDDRARPWWVRKFFYLFTLRLLLQPLRVGGHRPDDRLSHASARLARVGRGVDLMRVVANIYMSLFGRLRLDIKRERVELGAVEATAPRKRAS